MMIIKSMRTERNKAVMAFVNNEAFLRKLSLFILNCGMQWEQNNRQGEIANCTESYQNDLYEVDLCYGTNTAFIIVKTRDEKNLVSIKKWIYDNSTWQTVESKT